MPIVQPIPNPFRDDNKRFDGEVILENDGECIIKGRLDNRAKTEALRARARVVCFDDQDRKHWVSPIFVFPTMCGTWDPSCDSNLDVSVAHKLPDVVGELTRSVRVDFWEGESGNDWHGKLIQQIENAEEVYEKIKPWLSQMPALSGG